MSDHMKEYRFKEIRSYMGYLFADENKKNEGDPWWPFLLLLMPSIPIENLCFWLIF